MTKQLFVGKVPVGGGAPVSIQSMCNTKTDDVAATVAQIKKLEAAGLNGFITTKFGVGYVIHDAPEGGAS